MWSQFFNGLNGKSLLPDKTPIECACKDACDEGAWKALEMTGYIIISQWTCLKQDLFINEKEILAVVIEAHRWAHFWCNKRVIIYSDNSVTVSSINKASSKYATIMKSLWSFCILFWLSGLFNFHLSANFIPGILNTVADSLSSLHTPGYLELLLSYTDHSPLEVHMFSNRLDRFPHWKPPTPEGPNRFYHAKAAASSLFRKLGCASV